jgi:predicted DNA-binding transcriptional regulator YafY
MFGLGTKKMLNIMILKILERYSDEHRPLTQKRILELLDLEYGMKCDRRSVKSNLISLKEMGYDINIRKGVYIRRDFEEAELRMLIDSVLFSKTLSKSQAKRLIEKLKNLGSNQFSAKVNHICNLPELQHSDNTQVMNNLDTLNFAITKRRKVSFIYNSYGTDFKLHPRREEPYIVSPYQMAATNGRYYLIANTDDHDNISHYRIDKMTDVKLSKYPVKTRRSIPELSNGFSLPKHMAEHIYMFSGESIGVKFWTSETMMDSLIDWFGKDFKILEKIDGKILVSVKVNETAMKFWAMQYGENLEIIEPLSLRETIRTTAESIAASHN